jgi:ABC-type Fe3+/spermidine/putrescine transport system ATPase subunit
MDIYSNPQSAFAGLFIGHSNALTGEVDTGPGGELTIKCDQGLEFRSTPRSHIQKGDKVLILIRQERMRIHEIGASDCKPEANCIPASVELMTFQGSIIEYICIANGHEFKIRRPNEGNVPLLHSGDEVQIEWDPEDCILIKR